MRGPNRISAILLLLAASWSVLLCAWAFVVDVPVRTGADNLVRSASGGYTETPVVAQTYFQKYGLSELVVLGLGLVFVAALAVALRRRAARGAEGAGRTAWNIALACLVLGIIGSVTIAPSLLVVGILLVLACGSVPRQGGAGVRSTSGSASVSAGSPV